MLAFALCGAENHWDFREKRDAQSTKWRLNWFQLFFPVTSRSEHRDTRPNRTPNAGDAGRGSDPSYRNVKGRNFAARHRLRRNFRTALRGRRKLPHTPWKDGLTRSRHMLVYVCLYPGERPNSTINFGHFKQRIASHALVMRTRSIWHQLLHGSCRRRQSGRSAGAISSASLNITKSPDTALASVFASLKPTLSQWR
jgi:hypothetical protein